MQRILVIGNCGSGKTTLSVQLSKALDLPLYHLDKIHHIGDWQERPREEFDEILRSWLEEDSWIIDGNFNRTLAWRMEYCDAIIFLDFNRFACLYGAITRMLKYRGKVRPDMGGNCIERFSLEFYKQIWNYNKRNRSRYLKMLEEVSDKEIVILKNRRQVSKFLKSL